MSPSLISLSLIMFLIFSTLGLAQDQAQSEDDEKELLTDLYLSDSEFEHKYVKKFDSTIELRKAYFGTKDIHSKIIYLKQISEHVPEPMAYQTLFQIMSERFSAHKDRGAFWKIRASAIYLLGDKGKSLSQEQQIVVIQEMYNHFKDESDPHIIAVTAYSLVKLCTEEPTQQSRHRLLNKRTLSYLFAERLLALETYENFICYHIVDACIKLNDPDLLSALNEIRKKHFHPKVLTKINEALAFYKQGQ